MAINRNSDLPNKLTLIAGQSGSGKTTYLRQHSELKNARRLIAWDPYHDHKVKVRCETIAQFKREVAKGYERDSYSIALSVDETPEAMEKSLEEFFNTVWRIADGKKIIHLIVEEVADAYSTSGKASGRAGQVFRAGRAFGMIIFATTQSTAEIPKTLVKQCGYKAVFFHDEMADLKRAALLAGRHTDDIAALKIGQYYQKSSGMLCGELKRTRKQTR